MDRLLLRAREEGWSREELEILLLFLGSEHAALGREEAKVKLRWWLLHMAPLGIGIMGGAVLRGLLEIW